MFVCAKQSSRLSPRVWSDCLTGQMAAVTSTTACAPITSHNTGGSLPELTHDIIIHNYCDSNKKDTNNSPNVDKSHSTVSGLADKIHGLTERLHSLSYHRTEGDSGSRGRAGTCRSIRFITPSLHHLPSLTSQFPLATKRYPPDH